MTIIARTEDQRQIALSKLNSYVSGARERTGGALQRIMSEVPQDRVIRANAFNFSRRGGDLVWRAGEAGSAETVHRNALGQIADKTNIPMAYVSHMEDIARGGGTWAADLLARTLTEHFEHMPESMRFLARSVGGQTRALLSDKYRRIDARPSLDALAQVAQRRGAVLGDALVTDTRVSVKFILPTVFEPSPGEFIVLGLAWETSDYGRGATTLRTFVMRLFCWNGATMATDLRAVHLGARLSEDVSYSQRTYELDAQTMVSAIRDTANALFGDDKVKQIVGVVSSAAAEKIDPKAKLAALHKRIGKGLAEQVGEAYNRPDVEDLPAGNTAWRWSNALSWVAGHTDDAETRLDLERLAGDALPTAVAAAA
jgi:hypothetical protein